MIGSDLNNDGFIDSFDFGIFVDRSGVVHDKPAASNGQDGHTPFGGTPTPGSPYHADLSGDGLVETADFTFIQINCLAGAEPNCCGLRRPARGGPVTKLSLAELRSLGLGTFAPADLNGDRVLDQLGITAFLQGAGSARRIPATLGRRDAVAVGIHDRSDR